MITKDRIGNSFEFIALASARAKQLMRGATPRVEGSPKKVILAQREVLAGVVQRVDPTEEPASE